LDILNIGQSVDHGHAPGRSDLKVVPLIYLTVLLNALDIQQLLGKLSAHVRQQLPAIQLHAWETIE
jgi:hypothetical protein